MSFSSDTREELSRQMSSRRHCRLSELSAILSMCGGVSILADDQVRIRVVTENIHAARKFSELLRKLYRFTCEVRVRRVGVKKHKFIVAVPGNEDTKRILADTCQLGQDTEDTASAVLNAEEGLEDASGKLLARSCCRRAYLRGAFLSAGSISDPRKYYHFEIACESLYRAEMLKDLIASFDLEARIIERKNQFIVYIKEAAQIVEMLGVMEAPKSLMEMENIRILREISGSVNRQVNCETANLGKTVSAAVRQIEDIRYLQEAGALEDLPKHLKEMALIRLTYPEMALKDLGQELDPPLSKAGVNHRLNNLSRIAQEMREKAAEAEQKKAAEAEQKKAAEAEQKKITDAEQ